MTDEDDGEECALLHYLAYQRASVLSIVDGLDEESWHTSVVPSGWTPAGLVEHLGDAERHWFQLVVTGSADALPRDAGRPPYNPRAPFICEHPSAEVLAYYREQCEISDAVLARTSMSAAPLGRHGHGEEVPSVRWVVLHMIEETAAHTGHLEIARELLDGGKYLGLR